MVGKKVVGRIVDTVIPVYTFALYEGIIPVEVDAGIFPILHGDSVSDKGTGVWRELSSQTRKVTAVENDALRNVLSVPKVNFNPAVEDIIRSKKVHKPRHRPLLEALMNREAVYSAFD